MGIEDQIMASITLSQDKKGPIIINGQRFCGNSLNYWRVQVFPSIRYEPMG